MLTYYFSLVNYISKIISPSSVFICSCDYESFLCVVHAVSPQDTPLLELMHTPTLNLREETPVDPTPPWPRSGWEH